MKTTHLYTCSAGFEEERANKKRKHCGGLSSIIFLLEPVVQLLCAFHLEEKDKKNKTFLGRIIIIALKITLLICLLLYSRNNEVFCYLRYQIDAS